MSAIPPSGRAARSSGSDGPQVVPPSLTTAFIPEYDRHLDHVMMALGRGSSMVSFEEGWRLIKTLPSYTKLFLLTAESETIPVGRFGGTNQGPAVVSVIHNSATYPWLQDFGEGTSDGFIVGTMGRGKVAGLSKIGVPLIDHFLPLDGGNIQLAHNRNGLKIVLLGSNEFGQAAEDFETARAVNPRSRTLQAYRECFQADKVLVLPNLEREHIDQMVLFTGAGQAVTEALPELSKFERDLVLRYQVELNNRNLDGPPRKVTLYDENYRGTTRLVHPAPRRAAVGLSNDEAFPVRWMSPAEAALFRRYRQEMPHFADLLYTWQHQQRRRRIEKLLTAESFNITRLRTSVWHQLNCQNYVNAMPYINRETGRPELLFPIFHRAGESPDKSEDTEGWGRNRENIEILTALGITVRPVRSVFGKGGNLHCMMYQF